MTEARPSLCELRCERCRDSGVVASPDGDALDCICTAGGTPQPPSLFDDVPAALAHASSQLAKAQRIMQETFWNAEEEAHLADPYLDEVGLALREIKAMLDA